MSNSCIVPQPFDGSFIGAWDFRVANELSYLPKTRARLEHFYWLNEEVVSHIRARLVLININSVMHFWKIEHRGCMWLLYLLDPSLTPISSKAKVCRADLLRSNLFWKFDKQCRKFENLAWLVSTPTMNFVLLKFQLPFILALASQLITCFFFSRLLL